jgi:hypothetical protein
LPLTSFRIDPLVVDPRRGHRHRAGGGQHLAFVVVAVVHQQLSAIPVELVGEPRALFESTGVVHRRRPTPLTQDRKWGLLERDTQVRANASRIALITTIAYTQIP